MANQDSGKAPAVAADDEVEAQVVASGVNPLAPGVAPSVTAHDDAAAVGGEEEIAAEVLQAEIDARK